MANVASGIISGSADTKLFTAKPTRAGRSVQYSILFEGTFGGAAITLGFAVPGQTAVVQEIRPSGTTPSITSDNIVQFEVAGEWDIYAQISGTVTSVNFTAQNNAG